PPLRKAGRPGNVGWRDVCDRTADDRADAAVRSAHVGSPAGRVAIRRTDTVGIRGALVLGSTRPGHGSLLCAGRVRNASDPLWPRRSGDLGNRLDASTFAN